MFADLSNLYVSLMGDFHQLTTPASLVALFQVYFTLSRMENE
jgi:hypothetical protein